MFALLQFFFVMPHILQFQQPVKDLQTDYCLAFTQAIRIIGIIRLDILILQGAGLYRSLRRDQVPALAPVHSPAGAIVVADGVAAGGSTFSSSVPF